MKYWKFIAILSMLACNSSTQRSTVRTVKDTVLIRDTLYLKDTVQVYSELNWQQGFGITHDPHSDSIWGQPVDFYISRPECDALAFDFYYGEFRPADNASTSEFTQLINSDNAALRPFYRWCFNKTIEMADGALSEHLGEPARRYISTYPLEFLEYIQANPKNYMQWIEIINFSGLHHYQYDMQRAYDDLTGQMSAHCSNCDDSTLSQLSRIARDITEFKQQ